MYDPGEIYITDLRQNRGHEQGEIRPSILLTKHFGTSIGVVVPMTSKDEAKRFEYTFTVKKSQINGLSEDSIALVFQLKAIDTSVRLINKIGKLDMFDLSIIQETVTLYLNLCNK